MKNKRIFIISILVFLFVASVAGCASAGSPSPSPSTAPSTSSAAPTTSGGASVTMKNFSFIPATITIKAGETVTWTNEDNSTHDVAGDAFKSGNMKKGDTFSNTFNEAGTFDYVCTFHSGMNGKVIVE